MNGSNEADFALISANCAAQSEDQDVAGFAIAFDINYTLDHLIDSVIANTNDQFGVKWGAAKPLFDAAHSWERHSLWNILGPAADGVRQEWNRANEQSVTGLNMLLKNTTAMLNLTGTVMGAQLRRNTNWAFSSDPLQLYEELIGLPVDAMKMKEPMALATGCFYAFPVSPEEAAFRSPENFISLDSDNNFGQRPPVVVALTASGSVTPGQTPALAIMGRIHLEWRSNSLLLNGRIPPTDVAYFSRVLNKKLRDMSSGDLWMENPSHFTAIKKFAKRIVASQEFKTILRDAAMIGVESLGALLV